MFLDVFEHLLGFHDHFVIGPILYRQLLGKQIEISLAEKLVERPIHQSAIGRTGEGKTPCEIFAKNVDWQMFHEQGVQRFGLPQRLLGPFTLRLFVLGR